MSKPRFRDVSVEEVDQLSRSAIERLNQFRVPAPLKIEQVERGEGKGRASAEEQQEQPGGALLTTDEMDYLRSIHQEPFLNTGQREAFLDFTKSTSNAVKKALINKDLIDEAALHLGKTVGGYAKFTVLTEQGYRTIKQAPPFAFQGKKRAEHRFLQHFAHFCLVGQGFKARIEMNRGGKSADVGYEDNGERIALEIATRPDNEVTNAKRDLQAGFHRVIVLCTTRKVLAQVKRDLDKFLSPEELMRVETILLADSQFGKALTR